MKKSKVKKKIVIIALIAIAIILLSIIYQFYCFYQTRNIYDEFKQVFINDNLVNYDDHFNYRVECIKYDSSKYGNNRKGRITRWIVFLLGDKGTISCDIYIDYYDNDNNIVYTSQYFSADTIIHIKKEDGIWVIDRFHFIP